MYINRETTRRLKIIFFDFQYSATMGDRICKLVEEFDLSSISEQDDVKFRELLFKLGKVTYPRIAYLVRLHDPEYLCYKTIIPRHLCIKNAPNTVFNEQFQTESNVILSGCSIRLMNLHMNSRSVVPKKDASV